MAKITWPETDLSKAEVFGGKKRERTQAAIVKDIVVAYLSQQPGWRQLAEASSW